MTAKRTRRWLNRFGGVALVWALLALVTGWLGMRPDFLALIAVAIAASAVIWFLIDTADVLSLAVFLDEKASRRRPIAHGRLGLLRRLSEDAARRTEQGNAPPGAISFQQALRTIADRAITARLGRVPTDDERAARLGPDLAAYLSATDPPVLKLKQQSSFIQRIEAL